MGFGKTFGVNGIHPEEFKYLTSHKKIESADIPTLAYIPVSQHIGSPAKIIVEVGQMVEEGQLIAVADGLISANVHASIPGKVIAIEERFISIGRKSKIIVIELDGEFQKTGKQIHLSDWHSLSKDYILKVIKDSGIVGLGGATFSTYVKLNVPQGKKVDTIIINGTECEPFITCDHRLMIDKSEELLEGISIIASLFDKPTVYIGIENNKKDAIKRLKTLCHNRYPIKIVPLKTKYPQGDEKQLIKSITGRVVKVDKLPIDSGVVVVNVSTAFAIKEAVVNDKPLIDRFVTVTGSGVKKPRNLRVKIGTLIKDLIEECGGLNKGVKKIVIGGPMMGFAQMNLETPVTKGCSAIIAMTDDEFQSYNKDGTCINCGRCIQACAFGLVPTMLNKFIKNKLFDDAYKNGIMYCKECGACTWACPAKIPLVQVFRLGKDFVKKLVINKREVK